MKMLCIIACLIKYYFGPLLFTECQYNSTLFYVSGAKKTYFFKVGLHFSSVVIISRMYHFRQRVGAGG